MNSTAQKLAGAMMAVALTFALQPGVVHAQEQSSGTQQECTAQLSPKQVAPGQDVVSLNAQLGRDIGTVNSFQAPDGSGVSLASPEDFGKQQMTREQGEEPRAIQMADQGNRARVWLNTVDAETGQHRVILEGDNGRCAAQLVVQEESGSGNPLF